jgi:hypothetical protein
VAAESLAERRSALDLVEKKRPDVEPTAALPCDVKRAARVIAFGGGAAVC